MEFAYDRFERQFPHSRALPHVYLISIDLYRERSDRERIIEYGEKVLKLDERSVTAMMVLSRNYAIERKNLDRAVDLAQKAVDQIVKMQADSPPTSQTHAQWRDYLRTTETAARNILAYTKSIKGTVNLN